MHIYKFRILLEDNDQFFREIDIKANQTFEEFHRAIAESAGFDLTEMASFYVCDSKWNKQQELSLCDLSGAGEELPDDEDEMTNKKPVMPVAMMCETKMKDAIIDPHQRIIYVYDFLKMHTFFIELFKIKEAQEGVKYPLVVKSTGNIAKPPVPITDEEADEEADEADDFSEEEDESAQEGGMFDGLYDDNSFS